MTIFYIIDLNFIKYCKHQAILLQRLINNNVMTSSISKIQNSNIILSFDIFHYLSLLSILTIDQ